MVTSSENEQAPGFQAQPCYAMPGDLMTMALRLGVSNESHARICLLGGNFLLILEKESLLVFCQVASERSTGHADLCPEALLSRVITQLMHLLPHGEASCGQTESPPPTFSLPSLSICPQTTDDKQDQ